MPLSRFRPAKKHAELGDSFYVLVAPAQFPALTLRHRNQHWAERIGLDELTDEQWLAHFGRFEPLPGSF